jgi:putative transposase
VRSHLEGHYRRSIRLKGYDYRQEGAYFVTICTQDRECLFGQVVEGQMRVNPFGEIVAWAWNDLPNHNPHDELDAFVVMPNHVHGIVLIVDDLVGAGSEPAPTIPTIATGIVPLYEPAPTIPTGADGGRARGGL